MIFPPVVDYDRIQRVFPQVSKSSSGYNSYTCLCLFFIVVGILVLIKRYKDKQKTN